MIIIIYEVLGPLELWDFAGPGLHVAGARICVVGLSG